MTSMRERIVGGTLNERTTATSLMETHGIQWIDDFVSEHRVNVLAALGAGYRGRQEQHGTVNITVPLPGAF